MKRIWKILGTMGSFLMGFFLGKMFMSSIIHSFLLSYIPISNERELAIAFGVLIGLIVAHWWYKNTSPIK